MKAVLFSLIAGIFFLNTITGQITNIYTIQGTGTTSAYKGKTVTTEGIVTADFQKSSELKGFFIQDISGDNNPATSDGIFIFDNLNGIDVKVGDLVRVTGKVDEFYDFTEIKDVTSIIIVSSGNKIIPASLTFPLSSADHLEKYEGMLVSIEQPLTVIENFNLGRYGTLLLSAQGRQITATNVIDPNDKPSTGTASTGTSNVAAIDSLNNWYARNRITLDDGSSQQNPNPTPYLDPVLHTLRCRSTVNGLTGVLAFSYGSFNIHPTVAPAFNYSPRPAPPVASSSGITVASFNVLNFFNGNGEGQGFPTARGATTLAEFNRQKAKIFEALKMMNADIIGLMEIENDGDGSLSSIADLVKGLNAAIGIPGTYSFVSEPTGGNGNLGSDAIKVAMIYKSDRVTPVGSSRGDINVVHSRNPLAQTFRVNSNNEVFSVIVTHFKSKNCGKEATGLDLDQNDGQGCYNQKRKLQSQALISFVEKVESLSGDKDILIIGDMNSHEEEDPIDMLRASGLVSFAEQDYSFVFQGNAGSLDHALSTPSFKDKIIAVDVWHINADEPHVLDYNEEYNPPALYQPNPYRSSDHDPLIIRITSTK